MKAPKNKKTKTIKKKTPALENTTAQGITKTMLDNVAIGVSMINPKMEIIWLNKSLKERFPDIDMRKKPLCYQSFYIPPKEKICDYCPTIKAFKTGRVHSSETDVCADGKIYNVTATPMKDKNKKINYVIETVEDITERKKIEGDLREAEERFRRFAEASLEGIVITEKGRLLDVSDTFARIFGYEPSEIIGTHVAKLVAPEYQELVLNKIFTEDENPYETVCVKKNGERFPVEACGKRIVYKGKKARITSIRDITERNKINEAILKAKVEWEITFDNATELIALVDKEFKIIRCNKSLASFAQRPFNEILGHRTSEFFEFTNEHHDYTKPIEKTEIKTNRGRWLYVSYHPIINKQGEFIHSVIIASDITELKDFEQKLLDSERELKKRVEDLERFYQMAVGRELKMRELKKEMKSLQAELAKYKGDDGHEK